MQESVPYPLIHWTGAGVPGDFEIVVTDPPSDFVPYPLHLQLYTNYGVRQFDVPAPPPLPELPSTEQEVSTRRRTAFRNAMPFPAFSRESRH